VAEHPDAALLVVTGIAAVLSPVLAVILAGAGAVDRNRHGRLAARNALLAVGALAVLALLLPGLRFGILRALWS
jgi:hypothetical protein